MGAEQLATAAMAGDCDVSCLVGCARMSICHQQLGGRLSGQWRTADPPGD